MFYFLILFFSISSGTFAGPESAQSQHVSLSVDVDGTFFYLIFENRNIDFFFSYRQIIKNISKLKKF